MGDSSCKNEPAADYGHNMLEQEFLNKARIYEVYNYVGGVVNSKCILKFRLFVNN